MNLIFLHGFTAWVCWWFNSVPSLLVISGSFLISLFFFIKEQIIICPSLDINADLIDGAGCPLGFQSARLSALLVWGCMEVNTLIAWFEQSCIIREVQLEGNLCATNCINLGVCWRCIRRCGRNLDRVPMLSANCASVVCWLDYWLSVMLISTWSTPVKRWWAEM